MEFKLEKWKEEYIKDIAECANNINIANNLRNVFPFPYTYEDAECYVKMCIENEGNEQLCRAIVVDGKAVGSVGIFVKNDVYCKSAELGYWLAEECWKNGIMSNAVSQICKLAFETFDICRIFAEPYSYNKGSRAVLEKNGFELEGIMKNGVYKNGKLLDYCMYALLKN